jgi:hypothetical protein
VARTKNKAASPVKANSLNTLCLVGDQYKDSSKSVIMRGANPKLFAALDCYPLHAFSPEGRRNVCARFKLTDVELESALLAYERPGEPTEAERRATDMLELLRVIEEAVTPKRKPATRKPTKKEGGVEK